MKINEIIWLDAVVDKLDWKHGVSTDEVEEVFANGPQFRFVQKGNRVDEDVYMASDQTDAGRYLTILFIHKANGDALILSARAHGVTERLGYIPDPVMLSEAKHLPRPDSLPSSPCNMRLLGSCG